MYADVDVFISNYTIVDPDIYQLWIEGYSCKCIVNCCCKINIFNIKYIRILKTHLKAKSVKVTLILFAKRQNKK